MRDCRDLTSSPRLGIDAALPLTTSSPWCGDRPSTLFIADIVRHTVDPGCRCLAPGDPLYFLYLLRRFLFVGDHGSRLGSAELLVSSDALMSRCLSHGPLGAHFRSASCNTTLFRSTMLNPSAFWILLATIIELYCACSLAPNDR